MSHLLKKKSEKKVPGSPPKKPKTPVWNDTLQSIKNRFHGADQAWKGKFPAEVKRYTRFNYGNYLDFTNVVNDFFNWLEGVLGIE